MRSYCRQEGEESRRHGLSLVRSISLCSYISAARGVVYKKPPRNVRGSVKSSWLAGLSLPFAPTAAMMMAPGSQEVTPAGMTQGWAKEEKSDLDSPLLSRS